MAGHEALLDDALDEAHVDVAAGEQAHDVFALHVDLALEHGGHGRGAGGLDDLLAALHEQEHGLGDLEIVNGDDVVGIFLDERDGDIARRLDGDAVGNGGDGVGLDVAVRMERLRDRVRALSLHADDLHAGVDLLDARGHTGEQSAAAGWHDDDVRRGQVAEDLEAERALAGNDLGVIVGMQERGVLLLADLAGLGVSVVIAVAREHDVRAVALRSLRLGDGRGLGHDDRGRDAEAVRSIGHALCVVAGRRGHDGTGLAALDERRDLVARTADLERTGLLAVFVLEINVAARHGRERGRQVELCVVQHALEPLRRAFEFLQCDVHSKHPRKKFCLGLSAPTIPRENRKYKHIAAKCPRQRNFFAQLFTAQKQSRADSERPPSKSYTFLKK